MDAALQALRAIGTTEDFPVYYEMLAEVLGGLDRIEEACAAIDAAFEAAESSGLAYWNAELHRRRAELLWRRAGGPVEEARASLAAAFEMARAQNARCARVAGGDDGAAHGRGRRREASRRAPLSGRYHERFSEGFGTADLEEAGRMLGMASP